MSQSQRLVDSEEKWSDVEENLQRLRSYRSGFTLRLKTAFFPHARVEKPSPFVSASRSPSNAAHAEIAIKFNSNHFGQRTLQL